MKSNLLPRAFKSVGWLLFILVIAAVILVFIGVIPLTGATKCAIIVSNVSGATLIVCSRCRHEDDITASIRWSTFVRTLKYGLLLIIAVTVVRNELDLELYAAICLLLLPIIYVTLFSVEIRRYNSFMDGGDGI